MAVAVVYVAYFHSYLWHISDVHVAYFSQGVEGAAGGAAVATRHQNCISDLATCVAWGAPTKCRQVETCFFFFNTLEPRVEVIRKSMSLEYEPSSNQLINCPAYFPATLLEGNTDGVLQLKPSKPCSYEALELHLGLGHACCLGRANQVPTGRNLLPLYRSPA